MSRVIFCAGGEEFYAPCMSCVLCAPVTHAMGGGVCNVAALHGQTAMAVWFCAGPGGIVLVLPDR